jgi:hypothetical protein
MNKTKNGDPFLPAKLTESPLEVINSKNHLMDTMLNQFGENNKHSAIDVNSGESIENTEINEFELTIDDLDVSKELKETIKWLVSRGLPALPVVPIQDPYKYPFSCDLDKIINKKRGERGELVESRYACPFYSFKDDSGKTVYTNKPKPKFCGKNPSYIDNKGVPRTIDHGNYQTKLPTITEFLIWWSNPTTGIGSLGSWGGTIWIDIDAKNFLSIEECEAQVNAWLDKYPALKHTFIERTQSGGFTVGVKVTHAPPKDEEYTNFSFTPGGTHIGEAIGRGRFKVLSPSVGLKGSYVSINRGDFVEIDSLESIGIYPSSNQIEKKKQANKTKTASISNQKTVKKTQSANDATGEILLKLEDLITSVNKKILEGDHGEQKDRSDLITALSKDLIGWVNWCKIKNVPCETDYKKLVNSACNVCGIDDARCDRILESLGNTSLLMPATHQYGDITCWKKIYKVNKVIFDTFCPHATQLEVKKSMKVDGYELAGLTPEQIDTKLNETSQQIDDFGECIEECLNLPTDEDIQEKEERRKSRLKIYEETYASLDELPIRDDFSFFHPVYVTQLKAFTKYSQSRGATFGHALASISLMAGVSPITNVEDGIGIIDRPSYPYCVNVGDTTGGKSDVIPRPQYIAKKFLKLINKELSKNSYDFLIKECANDDKLKVKILGLNSIASFKKIEDLIIIKPIMLDSEESTTQGVRTFYGFFEFGKEIRTLRDDLYMGFYRHPLLLLKDEGGSLLTDIYLNQSSYYASRGELNECKEYLDPVSGDKMLASDNKLQLAINVPRTYVFNATIKDLNVCFNNDKSSSDGLTGRQLFNFMYTPPDFDYPIESETDHSKNWLKFFNLGAVIIAFGMSQKICHTSGDEIHEFVFNKQARIAYKAFDEERKNTRSNMIDTFPEWSSLIDNYFAKAWQGIIDVAPNLKRFNDCLNQFFKLLKIIYPKIQPETFLNIVSKNCKGDNLITFAKVLYFGSRLSKEYEFTDASSYTFQDLLDPTVKETRTGKITALSLVRGFACTEIESMARASSIVPTSTILNETDITHAANIVLNSCHSFGMILHSFNIKGFTASQEMKAQQARATDTLLKSTGEYGTEYRVKIIIDYLSKCKVGDTLTLGKLKKSKGDGIEKNEGHFESILEKIAELEILGEGVKNTRNQLSYEIKRIPKKSEIPKITKACDL